MSFFDRIFDVFSRRQSDQSAAKYEIPQTTRNRILLWCAEVFSSSGGYAHDHDQREVFWNEIHRHLQYRHGRITLSKNVRSTRSRMEDALDFLLSCSGDEFLDFIEYIFKVECLPNIRIPIKQLVIDLNRLFHADNLPYSVTDLVEEQTQGSASDSPFRGINMITIRTVAFPKVIMRENEAVYANAVEPALRLLSRPKFIEANREYLQAHEDYRREDYRDVLTKCGSAFESVLKICCHSKGWPYDEKDTAQALIRTLIQKSSLEAYFEPTLMVVATLRNRLSSSHGAGLKPKQVSRHIAKYALNITASAMLLISEEVGEG